MIGPPTLFVGMMDVPGYQRAGASSLRVVSCGAMGVTPEFIDTAREGLGAMVKRTYGSTEAPTVTTSTCDDPPDRARDTDGHSVGDAEVRVVDPATDPTGPAGPARRGPGAGPGALRRVRRGVPDRRRPCAGGGSPPGTSVCSTRTAG